MPKVKPHLISTFVTTIIKEKGLRQYLSDNFTYVKPATNNSPFEKLSTISVSLTGDLIENFMRIRLSIVNDRLKEKILKDVRDVRQKYQELYDKVIAVFYEKLERHGDLDKWIVYSDDHYDLVVNSIETNIYGKLAGISIVKKVKPHCDITIVEEKGYRFIKAGDYYGNIIRKIDHFEHIYLQLFDSKDFSVFSNADFLKSFVLFTHVAIRPQWLKISKKKMNIGFYNMQDILKVGELLKSIPDIDYDTKALYHPKFHIDFISGSFAGRLFATPDFIVNNNIIEVKASSEISRNDFYQLIIYYALSKHPQNIEYYGNNINLCELLYVKKKIKVSYDFSKTLTGDKLIELQDEIIKSIVSSYKASDEYRILKSYKML